MNKLKIIFFGNGMLSDNVLSTLKKFGCEILFHAREKADLETVKELKMLHPEAHGVLASFGVIIKKDVLSLFEPEGILNIHPSLLPKYRGPSPIETAILNGDTEFGVSIMKLVLKMDAGPLYYTNSFDFLLSTPKDEIYRTLAEDATTYLAKSLKTGNLKNPTPQKGTPSFTQKFDKSMSPLDPEKKTAEELNNQIRAFSGFPKSTYRFGDLDCIVIDAHVATHEEVEHIKYNVRTLYIQCYDKSVLIVDFIQPAGRKVMDAKSFINGYMK